MATDKVYGYRLSAARAAKGLTQQQVADAVGVTRQAVGYWENADRSLQADNIVKLAQALDITCDELLTGKKPQYFSAEEATGLTNETVSHLHDLKEADELDVDGLNLILMNPVFTEELTDWYSQLLGAYDELYKGFMEAGRYNKDPAMRESLVRYCTESNYEDIDLHRIGSTRVYEVEHPVYLFGENTMFEARTAIDITEYRFTRAVSRMFDNIRKEFSDKINASLEGES